MSPEPLRGKIRWKDINWSAKSYNNFTQANLKVEDVKSAVEFYKKYESNEELLSKEEPDKWKLYLNKGNIPYNAVTLRDYNKWLFNYCFGDVVE